MRLSLAVAVLALLSPLSAAARSDLAMTLNIPPTARPGETVEWTYTIENRGPDPAFNVKIHAKIDFHPVCVPESTIPEMPAGFVKTWNCSTTMSLFPFPDPDRYPIYAPGITAYIFPEDNALDPNLENNYVQYNSRFIELITDPDLVVQTGQATPVVPGLPFTFFVQAVNVSRVASKSATLTIDSPTPIISAPGYCRIDGTRAVCTIDNLNPGKPPYGHHADIRQFEVQVMAPDTSDEKFVLRSEITDGLQDPYPVNNRQEATVRTYATTYVTNANDSGSGSLRAAVESVNASCNAPNDPAPWPCLIAFRIPDLTGPWATISLQSALPRLTATSIVIDGTTQARYFADTNPAGPEIELSGAALLEGNGFELSVSCVSTVRGFAINGFPWNGIRALGSPVRYDGCNPWGTGRYLEKNYIGTDPTGMRSIPNMRGIAIDAGGFNIRENIISGNSRAGVFVERGNFTIVHRNTIGLNRTLDGDLGNGASGVYFSKDAYASDVIDNYIGFNRHAGIAIDPAARFNAVLGNSLQANHGIAIDRGLDGPADMQAPTITNVRVVDGKTIIEGTVPPESGWGATISLYANDAPDPSGYGEGQYFLGTTPRVRETKFTFTYDGDLRGKWVAATATRHGYYGWLTMTGNDHPINANGDWQAFTTVTSEFGRTMEVK